MGQIRPAGLYDVGLQEPPGYVRDTIASMLTEWGDPRGEELRPPESAISEEEEADQEISEETSSEEPISSELPESNILIRRSA